jgi:hypothetical protein
LLDFLSSLIFESFWNRRFEMANKQFFVAQGGPGTSGLLRMVLTETDLVGTFNLTFEEAALDSASSPSLASAIVAGANKVAGPTAALVNTAAVTETLVTSDSGRITICTLGSGTQTFTLPSAVIPGLLFTFVCGSAAGEILINPAVGLGQNFSIKASEGGASVVTAANTGIKNTAATNVLDDRITVVSDGLLSWWAIQQSGIFASQ